MQLVFAWTQAINVPPLRFGRSSHRSGFRRRVSLVIGLFGVSVRTVA
ncbi:hypothetical protein OOK60_08510 [Trichothermofontia sichuanensis B231]|nr:hypothetical protein [Trichothermofontia sichuanensis]UZQ56082.1 hypothetical protein OOK60_08510 [Trichothermofontia sichuanensis B231]